MKKGFTLIELLAVIVILTIIALIATPLVLKYIEKSRSESKIDSAYSFVRNLETEIANFSIKNNGKKYNKAPKNGKFYELSDFEDNKEIDTTVKGDNPSEIKLCLSSLGQIEKAMFNFNDGKYYVSYDGKKGSISDSDTYSNFSCSSGSEIVMEKQTIEFVEYEAGESYAAMLTSCPDLSFNYGEYYTVRLTDLNGNSYEHRLIAQDVAEGVTNINEQYPIMLSSTRDLLRYAHISNYNTCGFMLMPDSNGNFIYDGEYEMSMVSTGEKVEPNYVLRVNKAGGYCDEIDFYSPELKVGDVVTFEFLESSGTISYSATVAEYYDDDDAKAIYNKAYYKSVSKQYCPGKGRTGLVDMNVLINDEKVYSFKKEEFKDSNGENVNGCIMDDYYYVGNDDIDNLYSC